MYQRIGCFHSLVQPDNNPNAQPTVPVLSPKGFVRWQTFDLLRDPREHVPLLQTAVKRLRLVNSANGKLFPNFLPQEALPMKPDREILIWHEKVANQVYNSMSEAEKQESGPPRERAITDSDPESPTSSADTQSVIDAPSFSHSPRAAPQSPNPAAGPRSVPRPAAPFTNPVPGSRSVPSHSRRGNLRFQPTRHNSFAGPGQYQSTSAPPIRTRSRSASNLSALSVSSSSSTVTTDSESLSPDMAHSRKPRAMGANQERKYSGGAPLHKTASQPVPPPRSPHPGYGPYADSAAHLKRASTGVSRSQQSPGPGINVTWQPPGAGMNVPRQHPATRTSAQWQLPNPDYGRAASTPLHTQPQAWGPPPNRPPPPRCHAPPVDPHLHRARSMGGAKSPGVNHQDPKRRSTVWEGQDSTGRRRSGDWGGHESRSRSGGYRDI